MANTTAEVPRNDLDAARAFYERRGGEITEDEYQVLWMSQDDPAEFEAMSADWKVVPLQPPSKRLLE